MPPYLITAPAALPVTLDEVKAHLRVTNADENADISARIAGAIAHLDGWGGALNRCIMPQTWAVDVTGPGPHVLPFPEADEVTATAVSGALDVTVKGSFGGPLVTIEDAQEDEAIVVQFSSAIAATRLPLVGQLIKLMVEREFDPPSGPDIVDLERSIASMMNNLRWRRI